MMTKIGYARVSTDEQNLALQKHALKAAGCKIVIEDQGVSGAVLSRLGLSEALAKLKKGDALVVCRLDSAWPFTQTPYRNHRRNRQGRGRVRLAQ